MGIFSNLYVLIGIGFVVFAQIAFVYVPFMNKLFSSYPIQLEGWLLSVSIGLTILPIVAFEKWIVKKFFKR